MDWYIKRGNGKWLTFPNDTIAIAQNFTLHFYILHLRIETIQQRK